MEGTATVNIISSYRTIKICVKHLHSTYQLRELQYRTVPDTENSRRTFWQRFSV